MKKYVFVVGTGRCGTSLISNMLGCHPEITNYGESHFIPTLMYKYKDEIVSEWIKAMYNHPDSDGKPHPWQRTSTYLDLMQGLMYNRLSEFTDMFWNISNGKNKIKLDKTPYYGLIMNDLKVFFGNTYFIHIMRNKKDTIRSIQGHSGLNKLVRFGVFPKPVSPLYDSQLKDIDGSPVTDEEASDYIDSTIKAIRKEAGKLDDGEYYELDMEELIDNPHKKLSMIAREIGLSSWIEDASKVIRK